MPSYKIAHLREQGQDMIIIPLESNFEHKTAADQQDIIDSLQLCAQSAGLAGRVVPVWRVGSSHKYIAPQQWQPFFRTLSWNVIIANLNKTLTCN